MGSVASLLLSRRNVYFLNLAWEIVVVQINSLRKYIFPIGKQHIKAAGNMFAFFTTVPTNAQCTEAPASQTGTLVTPHLAFSIFLYFHR